MDFKSLSKILIAGLFSASLLSAAAPLGAPVEMDAKEQANFDALKGSLNGKIVWSTSRANTKHDIWIMNADGTDKKALTKSDQVDWFARFSPDGKTVVFSRSKGGWVPETDAKFNDKWDVWTINLETKEEKKVAENAVWGSWDYSDKTSKTITFARAGKAFKKNIETGEETLLFDAEVALKKGAIAQEPNLSSDGKYLAATIRGTARETGIYDIAAKKWSKSGAGCQIDWYRNGSSDQIYRMNPTGNGGSAAPSEVVQFKVKNGVQQGKVGFFGPPKSAKLMDLPGRRSHEYFPRVSNDTKYLIWCATDKGHDHDIYDYEIYIWKIGDDVKKATRITAHTGNDRWPDVFITPKLD